MWAAQEGRGLLQVVTWQRDTLGASQLAVWQVVIPLFGEGKSSQIEKAISVRSRGHTRVRMFLEAFLGLSPCVESIDGEHGPFPRHTWIQVHCTQNFFELRSVFLRCD